MLARLLFSLLLLAGCDRGEGQPEGTANANQIERLSTPVEQTEDPRATVRLEPLSAADLEREGLLGAGCLFTVGDKRLLAAVGGDAVVRIQGEIRHLVHSAPAGATGGFFEDRQLSVSVGRASESGIAVEEGMRWPARITVTNRRAEIEVEQAGAWTCGA